MESSTTQKSPTPGGSPPPLERKPSDDLPEGSPDALKEAADTPVGAKPFGQVGDAGPSAHAEGAAMEQSALDYLLGDPHAIGFDVPVKLYVPGGREADLVFVIRQVDGSRIIAIENEHRVGGSGPFSELDEPMSNAHLCAEATMKLVDKASGREVDPQSKEFIGDELTPHDAMRRRFRFQSGVLAGVATQIRRVSGYDATRVSAAERPVREAVGNS